MRRKHTTRLMLEALESRALLSTFFVAPTGADGAAGSAQAPWQTLQRAANAVQPGDTVIVQPGTYQGFELTTSGTAAAPITFKAQPSVVINQQNPVTQDGINLEGASYITIDGFTVVNAPRAGIRAVTDDHVTIINNTTDHNGWWGIFTGFSNYVDIENNTTTNSQIQHGIYVSNSPIDPILRNNVSYGNAMCGIHLNGDVSQGGTGVVTGALIVGNIIHDNGVSGGSGINGDGLQNSVIENNVLYNNHASGISLYMIDAADGAKNNLVANNTIIMASDARWAVNIQDGSTGNRVFNNILLNNNSAHGSLDISADSLPGFVSDYNVVSKFTSTGGDSILNLGQWQSTLGLEGHSLTASGSSLFANAGGNDYHLTAASAGLNRGTAGLAGLSAPGTDRDGNGRPYGGAYDVGAYEFVSGAAPAPVPAPVATPSVPVPVTLPGTPQSFAGSKPVTIVTGADAGGGPDVRVYDAASGALKFTFFAYDQNFTGGVRVAAGDVNGDGVADIITTPGPGGGPDVHVYDGRTGGLIRQFFAFNPNFSGGSYVAAGDVNHDGYADLIVGADAGGGPNVVVFSGADGSVLQNFFAYNPAFTGGVRVAAGDVNADGYADVIAGAGAGGGPNVTIFSGATGGRLSSFFAFDPAYTGGIYVSGGDVNGDGRADVIAGAGRSSNVTAFDASGTLLESFFPFDPSFGGGARVAAVDRNGDGKADVIAVAGAGGSPDVKTFNGPTLQQLDDFYAYSPLFQGGLYVAAA